MARPVQANACNEPVCADCSGRDRGLGWVGQGRS